MEYVLQFLLEQIFLHLLGNNGLLNLFHCCNGTHSTIYFKTSYLGKFLFPLDFLSFLQVSFLSITACPPAASAFTISPEYLIPPSAIIVLPYFRASVAQSYIAVICGTPTPATTRVVQIEPGPIPTFTTSAPASNKALLLQQLQHFQQ